MRTIFFKYSTCKTLYNGNIYYTYRMGLCLMDWLMLMITVTWYVHVNYMFLFIRQWEKPYKYHINLAIINFSNCIKTRVCKRKTLVLLDIHLFSGMSPYFLLFCTICPCFRVTVQRTLLLNTKSPDKNRTSTPYGATNWVRLPHRTACSRKKSHQ